MMNSDVGKVSILLLHAVLLFQRVLSSFLFFKSILPIHLYHSVQYIPRERSVLLILKAA